MKISGRSVGMCALFVIIGAIAGGLVGELMKSIDAFSGLVPYLTAESEIFTIEQSLEEAREELESIQEEMKSVEADLGRISAASSASALSSVR